MDDGCTKPACKSTLPIRRLLPGTSNFDCTSFSTPNTTPSLHVIPITVLIDDSKKHLASITSSSGQPIHKKKRYPAFSVALTAYSTWKSRPSGEKVVAE